VVSSRFSLVSLTLESLHGFKSAGISTWKRSAPAYVHFAHAHGTLLALVQYAARLTARNVDGSTKTIRFVALIWAAILLPLDSFLRNL